ncbi:FG-GAP-like repeat-containing protein [Dankookia sp. P2]|uniref:FG-GAP-like repeat-containing protein n=1 Tax=Dankookia sp. P2 TaxID=3423955 RepID=UPI003D66B340
MQVYLIGDDGPNLLDGSAYTSHDTVVLRGFGGDDTLIGGAGPDRLVGSDGYNTLYGGLGNDKFFVWPNPLEFNTVFGGGGNDMLVVQMTAAQYRMPAIRAGLSQLDHFMTHDAANPDATFTSDALHLTFTQIEEVQVRVDSVLTPITKVVPGPFEIYFENAAASYAGTDYTLASRWAVNGANFVSGDTFGSVSRDWRMVGSADFNGDLKSDVLWQNQATGDVSVWTMDGNTFLHGATVVSWLAGTDWKVFGTGDFDADGRAEILLARTVSDALGNPYADLSLVKLSADGQSFVAAMDIPKAETGWQVVGIGDFNGDGSSDLLWRAANGYVSIWEMNGGSYLHGDTISWIDAHWSVVGTGDFNADGYSDILWRNDDGRLSVWEMEGMAVKASRTLYYNPGPDWVAAGIADHDGDGKSDIVMRHVPIAGSATTALEVWTMDGLDIVSVGHLADVSNDWQTV